MSSTAFKKIGKARSKIHKERAQLSTRKHLGILEKKKDYKVRARDHHKKELKIRSLRRKAEFKNPDEFYFHMINSETKGGEHFEKEKDVETPEELAMMHSQDLRYIKMKRTQEQKAVARLQSTLHGLDRGSASSSARTQPNTHTFFVDSAREARSVDVARRLGTHPDLLDRPHNRPTSSQLSAGGLLTEQSPQMLQNMAKQRSTQYKLLQKRMKRATALKIVEEKMTVNKNVLKAGQQKPKKVKKGTATTAPVYKWQAERKR